MPDYQPRPDLLRDRIILVTGAGSGIGAAAACSFAAHGATVVLLGRTVARLEAVYDRIEEAGGPQPAIYPMDLEGATTQDYADLAQRLEESFGRLDGLLHNAAMLGTRTPVDQYPPEIWARVMHVNCTAPFLLTQAVLPLLRRSHDASVLFTGAQVGRRGWAYWGAYAVSNAAVENFMEVLAHELEGSSSVRVNSIDPGAVQTTMRRIAFPAEDRETVAMPEDIMPAYLYLMGPDSSGITGGRFDRGAGASDSTPGS